MKIRRVYLRRNIISTGKMIIREIKFQDLLILSLKNFIVFKTNLHDIEPDVNKFQIQNSRQNHITLINPIPSFLSYNFYHQTIQENLEFKEYLFLRLKFTFKFPAIVQRWNFIRNKYDYSNVSIPRGYFPIAQPSFEIKSSSPHFQSIVSAIRWSFRTFHWIFQLGFSFFK